MNNAEKAIEIKEVYKTFRLPHEQHSGVKQLVLSVFNSNRGYEEQRVLNDISFDIKKGEFFGIVGRNGSGKSTLLKLLAGIYVPDKGLIKVNGSLTPFIELGVGFNPELTGRENVFLNGALLGFSRAEMESMYDEIVSFSELERFMDQKLKNYSSGMQVRLAFSIAIRANSDILILDEVLAVGDEAFQKKCTEYFMKIKNQNQTVVLVTHDMTNVERFCDRVLVLNDSKVVGVFDTQEGKRIYNQLNRSEEVSGTPGSIKRRWGTEKARIAEVRINDSTDKVPVVEQGKPLEISIKFEKKDPVPIIVGIGFHDESNTYISGPNSAGKTLTSSKSIHYTVPTNPLNPGRYRIEMAVFDKSEMEEFDHMIDALYFDVVDPQAKTKYGKIELFGEWST